MEPINIKNASFSNGNILVLKGNNLTEITNQFSDLMEKETTKMIGDFERGTQEIIVYCIPHIFIAQKD